MARRCILGIFAHPDDESMGPGGTLAKYAAEGHRVVFWTATDGGAGRLYEERPADNTELRARRREETRRAANILGIEFGGFLGWEDRGLEAMSILSVEAELVRLIRAEKPDVVLTFHPSGISYHPDHRVLSIALMGAFLGAGSADWYREEALQAMPPHTPSRYYAYSVNLDVFDTISWPRTVFALRHGEVTTRIDTRRFADVRWRAIQAHDTQRNGPPFRKLFEAGAFDEEYFVRIFPANGEALADGTDLLGGL